MVIDQEGFKSITGKVDVKKRELTAITIMIMCSLCSCRMHSKTYCHAFSTLISLLLHRKIIS